MPTGWFNYDGWALSKGAEPERVLVTVVDASHLATASPHERAEVELVINSIRFVD